MKKRILACLLALVMLDRRAAGHWLLAEDVAVRSR